MDGKADTKKQSPWLWLAGILLSGVAIVFAVQGVRWTDVLVAFKSAHAEWVALGVLTVLLTTIAKAERWRWLLYPEQDRLRLRDVLAALLVGQMLNTLIPARAGDLARVYHLGERARVSKATILGSVVAEKATDMVMLALCALIVVPWFYLLPWVESSILVLSVTAAIALGGVLVAAWYGERLLDWVYPLLQRLPIGERLSRLGRSGVQGFLVFRSGRGSLAAWVWSIVSYSLALSTNYVLFIAMNIPASPAVAMLLMVVLYLGVVPPSLPGKIGIFHGITVLTLTTFGISPSVALAYGALLHLVVFLLPTLLGLLVLSLRPRRSAQAAALETSE